MPNYPIEANASKRAVLSLGGSLIVPNEINIEYLKNLRTFIKEKIELGWSFMIVTGGGAPARKYINAAQEVMGKEITADDMDWLGIHATRFNAHLVRTIFRHFAQPTIIKNPEEDPIDADKKIVVVSGWKPGWSTDYVSVKVAERINAPYVINLSNIRQVYTADPKLDPNAQPIEDMLWDDFRKIVGEEWVPGMNAPFDPIAAKFAREKDITVLVMEGSNLKNIEQWMETGLFEGTVLHN